MHDDIRRSLERLPEVREVKVLESQLKIKAVKGECQYTLSMEIGGAFPHELPSISLNNAKQHGLLPHVCWQSIICYDEGEGNSIDINRPTDIAVFSLQRALDLLPSDHSTNLASFYAEYEGYWARQDSIVTSYLFFEPGENVSKIRILQKGNPKKPIAILSEDCKRSDLNDYALGKKLINGAQEVKGYYLPLQEVVEPPLPGEPLLSSFITRAFKALSDDNLTIWKEIINKRQLPKWVTLLFSQPRDSHSKSLYGVQLTPKIVQNVLNKQKIDDEKILPVSISRQYLDYLAKRGGNEGKIDNVRLALVGCGSLGSRIAELCIQSGLTNIKFVDGDVFESENLFRHILGSDYVYKNKALALYEYFRSRFFGLNLEYDSNPCQDIAKLLDDVDGIIVAIGNPTAEREFNKKFMIHKSDHPTFMITAWLEAAGVGGHAILSDDVNLGCLHCLYYRDNSFQLARKTDFILPGQTVTRNLTGCGGGHVPYGAMHAQRTALMVNQMLLNHLENLGHNNAYQHWVNSNVNSHLKLSPYYELALNAPRSELDPIASDGCPVCRSERNEV